MKINGMLVTPNTYQYECNVRRIVQTCNINYEKLIEWTQGKQHQFITGKAIWTFAYLKKVHI